MDGTFSIGDYQIRPDLGIVEGPQGASRLEPRVMAVLELLARAHGRVISKHEFFEAVWGGIHVTDDALVHCISELRKVLGDTPDEQRAIQTIPKRGYRLRLPVLDLEDADSPSSDPSSRLTLERILASCTDHIYVYDHRHRYLFASAAGAQAVGLEPHEMVGRDWRELGLCAEVMEPFFGHVDSVFAGRPSVRRTGSYPTIYGSRNYEYVLDPVYDNGEVIAVVAFVREVCRPDREL